MAGTKLSPEKITSPFQLMAAWFSMLVLIVSVLLAGAAKINEPSWAAGYLVIFSSVVVLLVISCVTLMLTMFRPHLQEGKEYAQWLKDKGAYSSGVIEKLQIVSSPSEKEEATSLVEVTSVKAKIEYSRERCLISVIGLPGSVHIVEGLKNRGFNVEVYNNPANPGGDLESQSSIWIGLRMPPSIALEVIHLALSVWPNLKYLQLSGDKSDPPDYVHDQLFLGGATSTSVSRGLKAWTYEALMELKPSMTMREFHSVIRSKY